MTSTFIFGGPPFILREIPLSFYEQMVKMRVPDELGLARACRKHLRV
jgi:hypothetical protein